MSLKRRLKKSLFCSLGAVIGLFLVIGCSADIDRSTQEMVSYSSTARIRGLDPAKSGKFRPL